MIANSGIKFGEKSAASEVFFERDVKTLGMIMEAVEWIKVLAKETKTQGVTDRSALHLAKQIESSMLERGVFDMFSGHTAEMDAEFQELKRHTARYLQSDTRTMKGKDNDETFSD